MNVQIGVVLALLFSVSTAFAQADLRAEITSDDGLPFVVFNQSVSPEDVVEGCAGAQSGRTLVKFTLRTINDGPGNVPVGDPGCPECVDDPQSPLVCTNPLFACSPSEGHGHGHMTGFAKYELLSAPNTVALAGRKQGFCLADTDCPGNNYFYDCDFQGISAGCSDTYDWTLGCQYLDVTGLPTGRRYLVRATVNPDAVLTESNYSNNSDVKGVEICSALNKPKASQAKTGSFKVTGKIVVPEGPPLDPKADGLRFRLGDDASPLLSLVIPASAVWQQVKKTKWRHDINTVDGIQQVLVTRASKAVTVQISGRTSTVLPSLAEATVTLGAETGLCGAAQIKIK